VAYCINDWQWPAGPAGWPIMKMCMWQYPSAMCGNIGNAVILCVVIMAANIHQCVAAKYYQWRMCEIEERK